MACLTPDFWPWEPWAIYAGVQLGLHITGSQSSVIHGNYFDWSCRPAFSIRVTYIVAYQVCTGNFGWSIRACSSTGHRSLWLSAKCWQYSGWQMLYMHPWILQLFNNIWMPRYLPLASATYVALFPGPHCFRLHEECWAGPGNEATT